MHQKQRQMSETFRLGALLTVVGGFLDTYTYLSRGGVCAVEWSENVEEALSGAIRITIHKDPADENVRTITIEGGERFADLGV